MIKITYKNNTVRSKSIIGLHKNVFQARTPIENDNVGRAFITELIPIEGQKFPYEYNSVLLMEN